MIVTTHNSKLVDSPRAGRRMADVRQHVVDFSVDAEDQSQEDDEEGQLQPQQVCVLICRCMRLRVTACVVVCACWYL